MFNVKELLMPSVVLCALSGNAMTKEQEPLDFSFEARTEVLNDSSVGVSELDQNTEQSDSAWEVTLTPELSYKPNDIFSVNASYDWSRKEYSEQDAFNLDLGSLHLDASAKLQGFTLGSRYDRSDAKLSGEDFLILTQRSVYVARLMHQRWYWRVSGITKDKEFPGRENRNADNAGARIDLFAFLDNAQLIWALGIASESEDANDALLDHRGLAANVSLTRKFKMLGAKSEVKIAYRYRESDYHNYDASISASRLDTGHNVSLGAKAQVLEHMAVIAEVTHRDQKSNLDSAAYDEVVASAGLVFEF